MLKGKSLIDPSDFSKEEFREIFDLAHEIAKDPLKYKKEL